MSSDMGPELALALFYPRRRRHEGGARSKEKGVWASDVDISKVKLAYLERKTVIDFFCPQLKGATTVLYCNVRRSVFSLTKGKSKSSHLLSLDLMVVWTRLSSGVSWGSTVLLDTGYFVNSRRCVQSVWDAAQYFHVWARIHSWKTKVGIGAPMSSISESCLLCLLAPLSRWSFLSSTTSNLSTTTLVLCQHFVKLCSIIIRTWTVQVTSEAHINYHYCRTLLKNLDVVNAHQPPPPPPPYMY